MSSRIYRPQSASDAAPIAWRSQNAAAAHSSARRQEPGSEGGDLQKQLEARAASAYQQGLADSETAAAQRTQARLDPTLASLNSMLAELAGMRRNFRAQAEADTVTLSIAIARRILNRELTADPEAILGLVKAAFQKCDARETHQLRVSPQDAEVIREQRAKLKFPPALEIVADGALVRGSAIFETSRGSLDASLDAQLGEIDRGLADVLRRRNT
jgi:flagellar assembly protein FliH